MYTTNEIKEHTFINLEFDQYKVKLCTLGASIYSFDIGDDPMVLTPADMDDFFNGKVFHGKSVGRVSNRIKGNKVVIDGKEYILENNEGDNTLHGGIHGMNCYDWGYSIIEDNNKTIVTFDYLSVDGESGFPGNLRSIVRYIFDNSNPTMRIEFFAVTDKDTLCCFTNHAYYMLGKESLNDCVLKVNAHKYIDTYPIDLIAIGIKDCEEELDFSNGLVLNKFINLEKFTSSKAGGYDHYLFFDEINSNIPQITYSSDKYVLDIYTDFEGTQIYSDNKKNGKKYLKTVSEYRRGLAIEPSSPFNELHVLKSSDIYSKFIEYRFNKVK